MKVTAPEGVYLPALGRPVAEGETVDVPDEHGASLVEQGWAPALTGGVVPGPKAKRPVRAKAGESITTTDPAAAEQED